MRWLRPLGSVFARSVVKAADATDYGISLVPRFWTSILWKFDNTYPELSRKAFGSNSIVYACLRLLCQSVAEPPLLAYTESGNGELTPLQTTHPIQMLLDRPNELMTQFEMLELIEIHLALTGGSYWWKQRTNGGAVENLWPLRPDRIVPIYEPNLNAPRGQRGIKGWGYYPPGGGQPIPIPRSEILAFGTPDPAGETGGVVETIGWVQVLADEIAADNEATGFVGSLLANYAQPSMLIKTKMPIKDREIAKRLKAHWMSELGGAHKGEPALLDADTEIEKLSFDLKQLEFPDLRAQAESRIAAAAGVPPILAGLKVGLDHGTYSNYESSREYFADTTLSTKWKRYSDQFTNDLAPDFGPGIVIRFDLQQVKALAGQRIKQAEPVRDAFDRGAVTLAQYLAVIGLTVPDGVDGDVYYVPTNVKIVSAADLGKPSPVPPQFLPPNQPPVTEDATANPIEDSPPDAVDAETPTAGRAYRALADDVQRRADTSRDARSAALASEVTVYLDRLANQIVARWHETAKAWPDAASLFDGDDDSLRRILLDGWTLAIGDAYADASESLGLTLSFDLENAWVKDVLDSVGARERGIVETAQRAVQDVIGRGASEGLSVTDVANLIRAIPGLKAGHAETIALTESAVAYNLGSLRAYEESGLVNEVEVLDGIDFDAECKAVNGQRKSIEWARSNVIQHPRCRRAFAPVVRAE